MGRLCTLNALLVCSSIFMIILIWNILFCDASFSHPLDANVTSRPKITNRLQISVCSEMIEKFSSGHKLFPRNFLILELVYD